VVRILVEVEEENEAFTEEGGGWSEPKEGAV
jgi:hypothetical protein